MANLYAIQDILSDPTIVHFPKIETPEPSIEQLVFDYYNLHFTDSEKAKKFTEQYLHNLAFAIWNEW